MYRKMEDSIHCTHHLFYGNWNNSIGMGKKTGKGKKKSQGKGLLFGKNSPFNPIPILGDIF